MSKDPIKELERKAGKARKNQARADITVEEATEVSNFLFAVGEQFLKAKNAEAAFDCFKYALDLNPRCQPAVHNIAVLYKLQGNHTGANRMFGEAYRMTPLNLNSQIAYAESLRSLGLFSLARDILDIAVSQEPENPIVLSAEALYHYNTGDLETAIEYNDKILKIYPEDKIARLNKALMGMTTGRWSDHWEEYERWLTYSGNDKMRGLTRQQAWNGESLEGKTLLIISDQGSGDAIQFGRFIEDVRAKANPSKVIFFCQPGLVRLLERYPGVDQAIGFGEVEKIDYDAFTSLLGIMRVLGVDRKTCGKAPLDGWSSARDVEVARAKMQNSATGNLSESLVVGLVWAGDPRHGNDAARSIPIDKFASIFDQARRRRKTRVPIQLVSFQQGQKAAEDLAKMREQFGDDIVVDYGKVARDFLDTAHALLSVDILVTVDTSVAHLSGTLGCAETLTLLPNPAEWRWGLEPKWRSPWYPNESREEWQQFSLLRQIMPRSWESVISNVVAILDEGARQHVTTS